MQYKLDNYTRDPQMLMDRLAQNSKARRLDNGYSRKKLSEIIGVPAPTIARFEQTGKISLESLCRIAIEFDYFDELAAIMDHTKYSTSAELEKINKNSNRRRGR